MRRGVLQAREHGTRLYPEEWLRRGPSAASFEMRTNADGTQYRAKMWTNAEGQGCLVIDFVEIRRRGLQRWLAQATIVKRGIGGRPRKK